MTRIELMDWDRARAEASRIRFAVFVAEQGVLPEIELDGHDADCLHALAFEGDEAVGTGRLLPGEPIGRIGHIGRMAVLKPWRGRGLGSLILKSLVEKARSRGDREIRLSAQVHAAEFYRAHGFVEVGEDYMEAGILHRAMKRAFWA